MKTANESGLCPVCGNPFNSTAHSPSCETYVGEPKKKTEPQTFEARMFYGAEGLNLRTPVVIRNLAREADQRIAALSADLRLCTESAPLELVELVEELIESLSGYGDKEDHELLTRSKATIERWKV